MELPPPYSPTNDPPPPYTPTDPSPWAPPTGQHILPSNALRARPSNYSQFPPDFPADFDSEANRVVRYGVRYGILAVRYELGYGGSCGWMLGRDTAAPEVPTSRSEKSASGTGSQALRKPDERQRAVEMAREREADREWERERAAAKWRVQMEARDKRNGDLTATRAEMEGQGPMTQGSGDSGRSGRVVGEEGA